MIYELTINSTFAGQQCVNRFNYLSSGVPAAVLGSFALARAFGLIPTGTPPALPNNTVFSAIRAISSTSLSINRAEVRAASDYSLSDFYERPFVPPVAGTSPGEQSAPFLAFGFRTNRVRLDIRRGFKRFAGVPEALSGAGGVLTPDARTLAATLAARMSEVLTTVDEGNTLTFTPIVVSKQKVVDSANGQVSYRYYPTLTEQLDHIATGVLWEFYPEVRHQTSRQYGRGV